MIKKDIKSIDVLDITKKIAFWIMLSYVIIVIGFYFLAGEQLHLRDSRGDVQMNKATSGTIELIDGNVVEQEFKAKIQRLQSISIQWGTYYRKNSGDVFIELYKKQNNELIMSQKIDISTITEGYITTIDTKEPIEGIYDIPLLIRIYSPNSVTGKSVTPLMGLENKQDGFNMRLNGKPLPGTLCFSATGQDYIWTGLHYWKLALIFGVLLSLIVIVNVLNAKNGKIGIFTKTAFAVIKYKFLIAQLVNRDFKAKYKRSILGVFWSFLNPLLTMGVQYTVFSQLFRFDVPNYPVYLISGIVLFNFFSEACGMCLVSIVNNANLITKVYVPKYIYPLTKVISSIINLLISFIPLFIVVLLSGIVPTKAYFLLPFIILNLALFSLGMGMILATAMVFFRDVQFLWGVISMLWMYLTPLLYPETILPEGVAKLLKINPLYYFVKFTRSCIIDGKSPEPILYVQCFLFAILFLVIGTVVFRKNQDKFVLYL